MNGSNDHHRGALYIIATPIGNLADIVPRAVETLQQVDVIAAEDTRHSRRLTEHFHISTPMVAYHDFNEQQAVRGLIARLEQGENIALISDAGTPLVSDPGFRLVRAAQEQGYRVIPIPGACALIAALSASGIPSDRFAFEGFPPAKSSQRLTVLRQLERETRTLIFYESPHRLLDSLKDMREVFGADREAVMARELTKTYETIRFATLDKLIECVEDDRQQQKGEIVLLLTGYHETPKHEVSADAARIMSILQKELSLKKAANLTAEITGVNKKLLYRWGVENKSTVDGRQSTGKNR